MSTGCRATHPIPPPKKGPCRTYLATPLSLCRRRSSLQKRLALHGGVAAILAIRKFWERARNGKFLKVVRRGCKGLLSPGSENGVAPVQNGVAPVQNGFQMVQKTHLLHPLLTTFGNLPCSGSLPELLDCKCSYTPIALHCATNRKRQLVQKSLGVHKVPPQSDPK